MASDLSAATHLATALKHLRQVMRDGIRLASGQRIGVADDLRHIETDLAAGLEKAQQGPDRVIIEGPGAHARFLEVVEEATRYRWLKDEGAISTSFDGMAPDGNGVWYSLNGYPDWHVVRERGAGGPTTDDLIDELRRQEKGKTP